MAIAGLALPKATCTAGSKRRGSKKSKRLLVAREEQPPHFETILAEGIK